MKTQRNKSKQPAGKPSRLKNVLEILLVIAVILLIPLFFAIRSQAGQTANASTSPVPGSRVPPTRRVVIPPSATPTLVLPTAAPGVANGKEPPPCTFPLAQIKTAASAPANYMFSDPQAVLTAPKGNYYHIIQWLPDNQQVLITEDLLSNYVSKFNTVAQQSISLFNAVTGASKVYAIRPGSWEPPAWNPTLNAIVYPALNYTKIDKVHGSTFTRQVWVSHGDPSAAQKLADNLSQFPFGVKPDGSEMIFHSDNRLARLDKSLKSTSPVSFNPTQWDYAKERRNSLPVSFQMAWQPGTSLVFLYSAGIMGGGGYTFILNVDTGRVCELNIEGWAAAGARWSSDGRYLAIGRAATSHPADVTLLDIATGKLTTLTGVPQGINGQLYINDLIWAPDNYHLLAVGRVITSQYSQNGNNAQGLYLVDIVSGQSVEITFADKFYTNSSQSMAWSPDGSKLAVRCPTIQMDQICLISVK